MDHLRDSILSGDLVHDVRRLLQAGADDHGAWLRENLRAALAARRQDAVAVSALTGLAPGTVRGFLNGRPSSINNVLLMAEAMGYSLAELDCPPEHFRQFADANARDGARIGTSLLAFDESPTAMAIVMFNGTILKVNRSLRGMLGYEEGELVGSAAVTFLVNGSEERQNNRRDELEATGSMHRRASQVRRKDGSVVDVVSSAVVVRSSDGQPRYIIARTALA